MQSKYAVVIVTFQPDIERVVHNVKALQKQGFFVVIVDNFSKNIKEIKEKSGCDKLIELSENKGIAAALNAGMRAAVENGAEWTLSLDQDTMVADNLLEEYKKNTSLSDVGALCPAIEKRGEGIIGHPGKKPEEVKKCPTSGFFISTDAWNRVGEYDEWMFIDYVDYDIETRLRKIGFRIYRVNTTKIIQELGKLSVNRFFYGIGKLLHVKKICNFATTYNHSPFRNYYFVRNGLYYINKHKDFLNVREERSFLIKWEIKKLLLEKHRIANLKALIRGVRDFKRKKACMQKGG